MINTEKKYCCSLCRSDHPEGKGLCQRKRRLLQIKIQRHYEKQSVILPASLHSGICKGQFGILAEHEAKQLCRTAVHPENDGQVHLTRVGGCEDGAVLMTLCAMRLGVSAQHQVPSGSSHKLCSIDNSETVFGKAGVTFDAQPPMTKYTMMTTEDQYNAFVNSLTKLY